MAILGGEHSLLVASEFHRVDVAVELPLGAAAQAEGFARDGSALAVVQIAGDAPAVQPDLHHALAALDEEVVLLLMADACVMDILVGGLASSREGDQKLTVVADPDGVAALEGVAAGDEREPLLACLQVRREADLQLNAVGIEELLGGKVFLSLFVKVKEGWRDSERTIRNWGYKDE